MSVGNDFKNVILDSILGDDRSDMAPDVVYLALFTSEVGDDASGTEVSAAGYERLEIANTSTNFPAAEGAMKTLAIEATWPVATNSWGSIGWWALFDADGGGNLMFWGKGGGLNPPEHVAGSIFSIPAETLTIRVA